MEKWIKRGASAVAVTLALLISASTAARAETEDRRDNGTISATGAEMPSAGELSQHSIAATMSLSERAAAKGMTASEYWEATRRSRTVMADDQRMQERSVEMGARAINCPGCPAGGAATNTKHYPQKKYNTCGNATLRMVMSPRKYYTRAQAAKQLGTWGATNVPKMVTGLRKAAKPVGGYYNPVYGQALARKPSSSSWMATFKTHLSENVDTGWNTAVLVDERWYNRGRWLPGHINSSQRYLGHWVAGYGYKYKAGITHIKLADPVGGKSVFNWRGRVRFMNKPVNELSFLMRGGGYVW